MVSTLKKHCFLLLVLCLPTVSFAVEKIKSISITCPTQEQIANATKETGTGVYSGIQLYITTIKIKNGLGWITYYQNENALDNLESEGVISSKKANARLEQVICTYGKIHLVAGVALPSAAFNCQPRNRHTIICL